MFELDECLLCCNTTVSDFCSVCSDLQRDPHTIMVVEMSGDLLTIEQTGSYNGLYHVLHGAISPVKGIGPNDLRIRELVRRVEDDARVKEVIIATHSSQEGEATAMFIQRYTLAGKGVKVTRLHLAGLS